MNGSPPRIFDPKRRMALRARALHGGPERSFLLEHLAAELKDRLDLVSRDFGRVLLMGPVAAFAGSIMARRTADITCEPMLDEETLPFEPGTFDLILSAGTLDSVNDLPGALVQIRRCLKPDGLFLGALFGSGSLQALKMALLASDGERALAHIHPQIDLKAASDLLGRAGFTLPVADLDRLEVRYGNWRSLVADLRAAGIGNALAGTRTYAGRDRFSNLDTAWSRLASDGKVSELFNIIHLSGWAPAPNQPKPARRGSGQVSLADFLPKPKS